MNSLILDCSCGMNVTVIKDDKVFLSRDENNKKHTDDLLVVVDAKLSEAGINVNELDYVGVCVGPGSFTGIRVAASMVKGLAVNSKAQVVELSNFDSFKINEKKYVCVLDGFSSFAYARFVDGNNVFDECIDVKDLMEKVKNGTVGSVYVLSQKTQNNLLKYEIDSKLVENNIIDAFLNKIQNNEFIKLNQISPVYLRASQAEIERNKKLKLD